MSRSAVGVLLLSASTLLSGQAGPTFEVASIRPSSEQVTQVTAGVRIAGSQVRFVGLPLKEYIVNAFGVKPQQIVGPDWLGQGDQRFDLAATIPAGGSAEQLPQMLQALLADRFQMKAHRESREFPVYALGVAKSGPKLQPSQLPEPAAAAGEKPPPVEVVATGTNSGTSIDLGGGSSVAFGNNQLVVRKMTMATFAELLTRFVDRAVVDQTGLTGAYDVVIDIAPEDYQGLMIRSAVNAGVALPPQALRMLDNANTDPLSGPLRNVGLTLESRRAPLDVIVVDSISKTPTEN
jgi:uncharacterized protein (TIGR03435 family)